jgi:hypothetical protein
MALISIFEPTDQKISDFVDRLMTTPLYVSDEHRDRQSLKAEFSRVCSASNSVVLDLNGGGLLGFTDVIEGWKCRAFLKLWDKTKWSVGLVREMKQAVKKVADTAKVFRFETQTADPVIVKLAGIFGFKKEGVLIDGFRWDGKFYDLVLMANCMERRT